MKIVIVGDGISGLFTAYFLSLKGYRPVIISDGVNRASDAAQGIYCSKGLLVGRQNLFKTKLKGQKFIRRFLPLLQAQSKVEIDCRFQGVREPYIDISDFHSLTNRVYKGSFWGAYGTQNNKREMPYSWCESHLGYLFYPEDGWVAPDQMLSSMRKLLMLNGVDFLQEEVKNLTSYKNEIFIHCKHNEIRAKRVILATGGRTGPFCEKLNIDIPSLTVKGGLSLRVKDSSIKDEVVIVKGTNALAISKGDIYCGGTTHKGSISEKDIEHHKSTLLRNLKEKMRVNIDASLKNAEVLIGDRCHTKDRAPIIGTPDEDEWHNKLYYITGMYKNGYCAAPLVAQSLVKFLLGLKISHEDIFFCSNRLRKRSN